MSDLYQLYAFATDKSWSSFLSDKWPDAPLVNGYRILVFTNRDYPHIKEQYPDFEAKELALDDTIIAMSDSKLGPFVCSLEQTKQIISYFNPPESDL